MNFLHSLFGLGALGLVAAGAAACSSISACMSSCATVGDAFPLSVPCGKPPPIALTVSGPCAIGPGGYQGETVLTFTDDGTCRVNATFADGTSVATEVSRRFVAPVPGQCCVGGDEYTGLSDFHRVQLGGEACSDGGGYFGEDAGADASDASGE